MHESGNKYLIRNTPYMLVKFFLGGKEYGMMVDLEMGNRWVDPIEVKDMNNITEDEFGKICGGDEYELITDKIEI